jgi:hypothetical protein
MKISLHCLCIAVLQKLLSFSLLDCITDCSFSIAYIVIASFEY